MCMTAVELLLVYNLDQIVGLGVLPIAGCRLHRYDVAKEQRLCSLTKLLRFCSQYPGLT